MFQQRIVLYSLPRLVCHNPTANSGKSRSNVNIFVARNAEVGTVVSGVKRTGTKGGATPATPHPRRHLIPDSGLNSRLLFSWKWHSIMDGGEVTETHGDAA